MKLVTPITSPKPQNWILSIALSVYSHFFVQYGFMKSVFYTYSFEKLVFCLSVFFACSCLFLGKRGPNKYCLWEVNLVFWIQVFILMCETVKFILKNNSLKCWWSFCLFLRRANTSSTNNIDEGKKTFVHVVIQSLKDHINSLENQLKEKQNIMEGLLSLSSCQCSCTPPTETIKSKN